MLDIKPTETSILHVNNNSFTGPLITGAFEKRALGLKTGETCSSLFKEPGSTPPAKNSQEYPPGCLLLLYLR